MTDNLAGKPALSHHEKKLARHALGLNNPDANGKSYRNRYLAAHHSLKLLSWREMVQSGMAREGSQTDIGVWFCLTRAGAEAALNKGERLCPEDFPQTQQ